jgi:lysozyme family protein
MADYLQFIPIVLENEGFRSDDEGDSGGLTIWGLTKVADGRWEGWQLVNQYIAKNPVYPHGLDEVKDELKQMAIPWYKAKYWDVIRGDEINNQDVANSICDEEVNGGSEGIILAQKTEGLPVTGKMDDKTLNALNNQA